MSPLRQQVRVFSRYLGLLLASNGDHNCGAKAIFLPPRPQVLGASALAAEKADVVTPLTVGGSISAGTTSLLPVFSRPCDLEGKPFDQHIKDHRGLAQKAEGIILGPVLKGFHLFQSTSITSSRLHAGLASQDKKASTKPQLSIGRRFNALHTTVRPGAQPPV